MNTSSITYALLIVFLASLTTVLLRAFPFIAFGRHKETPPLIRYLGSVISPAAIAMLTVYCLFSHWHTRTAVGAELIASTVVVALQMWKKNPLLSIVIGTIVYMFLVQGNWC
ncbi:MAG: branched-chain amino acid transporter AzlD [Lentisphaerae bacterium]|nr:branched-chain amino acid transporter AzlD [Lentisphaerota bacterium]MBR2874059.1 AzlD domain-containing protein [Lentisphaeria bacterium]